MCLGIFGIASRWSSDPRVLPDDVSDKADGQDGGGGDGDIWSLAGWKYVATGASECTIFFSFLRFGLGVRAGY